MFACGYVLGNMLSAWRRASQFACARHCQKIDDPLLLLIVLVYCSGNPSSCDVGTIVECAYCQNALVADEHDFEAECHDCLARFVLSCPRSKGKVTRTAVASRLESNGGWASKELNVLTYWGYACHGCQRGAVIPLMGLVKCAHCHRKLTYVTA